MALLNGTKQFLQHKYSPGAASLQPLLRGSGDRRGLLKAQVHWKLAGAHTPYSWLISQILNKLAEGRRTERIKMRRRGNADLEDDYADS